MAPSPSSRSASSRQRPARVTIVIPLSGPHRLEWLEQAIGSVPLDASTIEALHIVHSGGDWTWAPELRQRLEQHAKVRIYEFADKLAVDQSLNRCMGTVSTRWGLLLPDDDALLPEAFSRALTEIAGLLHGDGGLIAFGWYYRLGDRYRAEHVRSHRVSDFVRCTPKICTTLVNVAHFLSIGGFEARYGSYCDTVAYARLVHRFGAWTSRMPVGIYRLHGGQISVSQHAEVYLPALQPTIEALSALAPTDAERQRVASRVSRHAHDVRSTQPHGLSLIAYWLRSHARPADRSPPSKPTPWRLALP